MKWKKKGLIFNPLDHQLSQDFFGYAQSPQALIFPDFVRIYFSVRKIDQSNGKFLSHIQYIDMDKKFGKVINVSKNEVISLGNLGCYDEHGIFPMNVLRYEDRIFAYISGWTRRVSVSADSAIGLAYSYDNGETFQRIGDGPIMSASLHEPFLVADAFVQFFEGQFHMWYIFGQKWIQKDIDTAPDRVYKIAHATSNNGIDWKKEGRVIVDDKYIDECQALPTVIKIGERYHMYFCYRSAFDFRTNPEKAYRLGYCYSDNLINWTRDDSQSGITTSDGEWDSDMMCYPHIFRCENSVYLLYNGNEFGKHGFGLAKLEES